MYNNPILLFTYNKIWTPKHFISGAPNLIYNARIMHHTLWQLAHLWQNHSDVRCTHINVFSFMSNICPLQLHQRKGSTSVLIMLLHVHC